MLEQPKRANNLPFTLSSLTESSVSERCKRKFFESTDCPGKIIRIEDPKELSNKHGGKYEILELIEIAKKLYKELEGYGILIPVEFFIGNDEEGNDIAYSVVDKIEGKHLEEVEKNEEAIIKIEALYTAVAKYFFDKSNEGGLYLWDICGGSQYIYGKKVGDVEDKIYLIDTDIWLNNSKRSMYLVVYWLTRHMSGAEINAGIKFMEARNYVDRFIGSQLPDNMSDVDMKNVDEIKKFLKGEKSDYNPESAIPNFE